MGHSAARCRNPKRCGRCWGQGHIGSFCKTVDLIPNLEPPSKQCLDAPIIRKEPAFEEVLHGQLAPIELPDDRPLKNVCYIERDAEYYAERATLDRAVVMCNPSLENDLTIDQVAQYAVSTKMVKAEEVTVGTMTRSRYVILLPLGVDPAKFIRAVPAEVWDEGFSFSLWSPLDDATVAMPCYKVMLDLVGIPPDLYKEQYVIRATAAIGTYLGTVEQPTEGDVARWTVVLATSSLSLIPHQISYRIGGLEFPVVVIPKVCSQGEVYKEDELPQPKEKFMAPVRPLSSSSSEEGPQRKEDDHYIGSRRVLEELCQGIQFELLPIGVQAVLRGARSMTDFLTNELEAQRSQILVTQDPSEEVLVIATTENHQEIPMGDPVNQGVFPDVDLFPTAVEDLHGNGTQAFGEKEGVEKDVVSQSTTFQKTYTRRVTEEVPKNLPTANKGHDIDIPVQSVSITAVSPNSERNILFMASADNPPRILQRQVSMATAISQHGGQPIRQQLEAVRKESIGPKILCEPTRQEKKRLLLESTKQKRKRRGKAQLKEGRADSFKDGFQPKAAITNEEGLVEIQVEFEHCARIAEVTGFQTSQVVCALHEDNAERAQANDPEESSSEFDPQTEDVGDSDEE